jgi:hypothetical protein
MVGDYFTSIPRLTGDPDKKLLAVPGTPPSLISVRIMVVLLILVVLMSPKLAQRALHRFQIYYQYLQEHITWFVVT